MFSGYQNRRANMIGAKCQPDPRGSLRHTARVPRAARRDKSSVSLASVQLKHLCSTGAFPLSGRMQYISLLLFLDCKQNAVGNKKNKYSSKPCPMAVSLRRCPANVDTHGGCTATFLVWSRGRLVPSGPFAYLAHPWWPCLLGAKQPSFLCLLCTHFSQSTPFPCPCMPSGYPPAMQGSAKDQDLWRAMTLQLVRPTWGRSVSGGSQFYEKNPTDFHRVCLLLEIVQYFVCHFQNSFGISCINPDPVNSRQQFSSSVVLKNKKKRLIFSSWTILINRFLAELTSSFVCCMQIQGNSRSCPF